MEQPKTTDEVDKRIRIVSGALIGILVGIFGGLAIFGPSPLVFVFGTALTLVFSLLAVRFGDTFWLRLSSALRSMSWLS